VTCLIVGAGLAGLTAARRLTAHGWRVQVLDKGRGVGGRMATRRINEARFDHGAQFFTVREPEFAEEVKAWEQAKVATRWFETDGHWRYSGVGGMNAIPKYLAQGLSIETDKRVLKIDGDWDATIITAPVPQAIALVEGYGDEVFLRKLRAVEFDPCLALMALLDDKSRLPDPGYARPTEGPIEWIADNALKGVSSGNGALTIHARPDFSREHWAASSDEVTRLLLEAAEPYLGAHVVATDLQRWRYSKPTTQSAERCLYTEQARPLAIAGDGLGGSRIEGAYLSGIAAAEKILGLVG
jgi:hypothetical protein